LKMIQNLLQLFAKTMQQVDQKKKNKRN